MIFTRSGYGVGARNQMYNIYKITNNVNGEFYIGITIRTAIARFKTHKRLAITGGGFHLHAAMRKFGIDSFSVDVLEWGAGGFKEGSIIEEKYIDQLSPQYNETSGGEGFTGKHSEETRRRMTHERIGAKNSFYGKTHTSETKMVISEIKKKDYLGEGNPFYGKRHSIETRERIARCTKTQPRDPKTGRLLPKRCQKPL